MQGSSSWSGIGSQAINGLRVPQATVLQLEHNGLLIAEQLLAAEAPAITPDQIQDCLCVADQVSRFFHPRFQESCHPSDQYTRGLEDMTNASLQRGCKG